MHDPVTPWAEDDLAQLRYHCQEVVAVRRSREALELRANLSPDRACSHCGHLLCSCSFTQQFRRGFMESFIRESNMLAWRSAERESALYSDISALPAFNAAREE